MSPDEAEYTREDGLGPFPPAWPAAAIVIRSETQEDFDATFCMLAGPDLSADNAIDQLPKFIRFAILCRDADLRGRWVWFGQPSPTFVLVYHSGGTAGSVVKLFARCIGYNWTTDYQSHSFACVLETYSQGTPLVGDVDDDGFVELLTTIEQYGGAVAQDAYKVWDRVDGRFVETQEIAADQVTDHPGFTAL